MGECWGLAQKQNSALAPKSSTVLWKTRNGVSARRGGGGGTSSHRYMKPFHMVTTPTPLGPFCDPTLPWTFACASSRSLRLPVPCRIPGCSVLGLSPSSHCLQDLFPLACASSYQFFPTHSQIHSSEPRHTHPTSPLVYFWGSQNSTWPNCMHGVMGE